MRRVSLLLSVVALVCYSAARPQMAFSEGPRVSKLETLQTPQSTPAAQPKQADKKDADCGCEAKIPPDVLAIVNGTNIPTKDIDDPLKDQIQQLQNQVIEARKRQMDIEINARLLGAEAV